MDELQLALDYYFISRRNLVQDPSMAGEIMRRAQMLIKSKGQGALE
jgi:hypothetical protein